MNRFFGFIFVFLTAGIFTIAAAQEKLSRSQMREIKKAQQRSAVINSINNKELVVLIDRIYPLNSPPKASADRYKLRLIHDTLTCHLPYIGVARSAMAAIGGNSLALSAKDQKVNTIQQYDPKTDSYLFLFDFMNENMKDTWTGTLQVYTNGKTNIRMEGNSRDAISYTGYLLFGDDKGTKKGKKEKARKP